MPIYLYWGNDEFAIAQAATTLREKAIDPAWESFNFDKISADQPEALTQTLNQAMTPPFGSGGRLVWLINATVCQRCPEDQLQELEQTLPRLPETTTLLFTTANKPDSRLKSTKLLQKYAEIRDFSLIDGWKTDLITKQVRQTAQAMEVKLTAEAVDLLVEAIGSDTRRLHTELEKLRLYGGATKRSLTEADVGALVTSTTQNAFKLAAAIRLGQTGEALEMVAELLRQNEPPLLIVASLVKQFRTWTWIKVMLAAGERDELAIAQAAEIGNPKRLYFLKQEVQPLGLSSLLQTLPILLELEANLKSGADTLIGLQTAVVELCALCRKNI